MGTLVWDGKVEAVAQQATGSIDSVDATPSNNTFTVTIGGVSISQAGDTDVATTAAALVALLNASTHPYFSAITWTNPTGGDIQADADTAGADFTAVLSETGAGTGSVTDFADDVASTGPNDVGNADNYDTATLPAASDDLIVPAGRPPMTMNLSALSAITLNSLTVLAGAAAIGLRSHSFATSADGESADSSVPEYRQTYFDVGATNIDYGEHFGTGSPTHNDRIKIDNGKSGASLLRVHAGAETGESNKPAIQYIAANASADIEVRGGSVGIATDSPGETATVGDINVVSQRNNTRVFTGDGCTISGNWKQRSGINRLAAAATVASVEVNGGELDIEGGDYAITAATITAGVIRDKHTHSSAILGTLNLNGGTVDYSRSDEARTVTTINHEDGTLVADFSVLTVTNYNEPTAIRKIAVSQI